MCESWEYRRLDELGGKKRPVLKAGPFGSAVTKDSYVEAGFKVYGQQEVVSGDVNAERYYISPETFKQLKSCEVEAGDILITMMGTVGRLLVIPENAEPGIINPRLMRISLDKSIANPSFVSVFLSSSQIQRLLDRRAHGGTMPGLNTDALGSLKIPLPPLPEQRKIAEILRTWDEAIEKLEALRAAKRDHLTGLQQKLLGRGGAFPDHWEKHPLSLICNRVRRQNGGGDHPVMTISAKSGFRLQSDKFSRDMAGSSVERYLPLPIVLRIARDVLQGLEYLHARNFFHNDIKPGNILLGRQQQAMLSDYGITGVSANGAPVPAPDAYLLHRAPEVVATGNIGIASDLFQVGMTLARLLLGLNHLNAVWMSLGPAQYEQDVAAGKLLTQKDFPSHIPAAVRRVVLKAVHPDPAQRFSSALEMRRACEKLVYPGHWTVDATGNEIGKCGSYEYSYMIAPVSAGKLDVTCNRLNIASGKSQRVTQFCKRGQPQKQAEKVISNFKHFVVTGK